MNKPAVTLLFSLVLGFTVPALGQDGDEYVISVSALVEMCESCHGRGGVSRRNDVPTLAGQPVDAILDSLDAFYFRQRHCPETSPGEGDAASGVRLDMCNISASLSRVEKVAVAEYFSAQTPGGE